MIKQQKWLLENCNFNPSGKKAGFILKIFQSDANRILRYFQGNAIFKILGLQEIQQRN